MEKTPWGHQVASRNSSAPPSFGHSKREIWSYFGKNVVASSDSSSSNSSSMSADVSSTQLISVMGDDDVVYNPTDVPIPVAVGSLIPTPNGAPAPAVAATAVHPHDADSLPAETDFFDPEIYDTDDDALMEYEEDSGFMDDLGGIPADMTHADFDTMLANIPVSEEFELPPLSNPTRRTNASAFANVAPSDSPWADRRSETALAEGSSKTESGKRKLGEEEGESACSELMCGGDKRGKNVM